MAKVKRKLLIAYGEEKTRIELEKFFDKNDFLVYTATNGKEAIEVFFANNHQVDLLIVDQKLSIYTGMEVVKMVREYSQIPIIYLAAEFTEDDLIDMLNEDVDHYIVKPFKMKVLKAFVDKMFRRYGIDQEEDIVFGSLRINQTAQKVYVDGEYLNLTPKEYALLHYFVKHKNMLFTRETILDAVWGYDYQGDIRTVDTLIKQLRKKIRYPYIQSVYGSGYRLEEEHE